MGAARHFALLLAFVSAIVGTSGAAGSEPDRFAPLQRFIGEWAGTASGEGGDGTESLVFDSESFENFSNAWGARETYKFLSADEFVETFELAPPGKPYQVYSRNQVKRVSR